MAHETTVAKATGKRKTAVSASDMTAAKKSSKTAGEESPPRKKISGELKRDAEDLIGRINAVDAGIDAVYDTCPQVVAGIKLFLQREGVTKASLLAALGGINSNSLNKFLSGKKQDQCGNVTYRTAYVFLEKLRILEGKNKSAARLRNEVENPNGVRGVDVIVVPIDIAIRC